MAVENNIREATEADLDAVYKLWLDLMEFHKTHHAVFRVQKNKEDLILEMLKEKFSSPETKIFLAEQGTKAIGMLICRFQIVPEAFYLHRKAYIGETMVDKGFQNLGIGEHLYLHAENYFKEKAADHIELQVSVKNPKAIAFWEKRGFVVSTKHMILELD